MMQAPQTLAERRQRMARSLHIELIPVFIAIEGVFRARVAGDQERLESAINRLWRARRRYLDYLLEREENGD